MKRMKRMKNTVNLMLLIVTIILVGFENTIAQSVKGAKNVVVASKSGKYYAWPANNGVWTWNNGKEILVGYVYHDFVEQEGHNIKGISHMAPGIRHRQARSTDGGLTWTSEELEKFDIEGQVSVPSPGGIDFQSPGFAMRVFGNGYHGSYDPNGHFFVSYNRGKDWQGPYQFNGLMEDPNLEGLENSSRTAYIVTGPNSCLIFMSARGNQSGGEVVSDKTFVAETTDGGKTFRFVSWIVPQNDPYRAVMPDVVRLKDGSIVVVMRRRDIANDPNNVNTLCWVDCYSSKDNGRSWSFMSRVGHTGMKNGNPPALTVLKDGRLVCVYGNRNSNNMLARVSSDGGINWGPELVLNDNFQMDKYNDADLGYPRVVTNHKNEIVAMYYWATKVLPEHFIAGTILKIKK